RVFATRSPMPPRISKTPLTYTSTIGAGSAFGTIFTKASGRTKCRMPTPIIAAASTAREIVRFFIRIFYAARRASVAPLRDPASQKAKARLVRAGPFAKRCDSNERVSGDDANVLREEALRAALHFELHLLSLLEGAEALRLNRSLMA